jgi:short-subunit dehydrogenase
MLIPEEVATRTLDALGKGPRVVPGLINRITAQFMTRLLPRRMAIRLIARNTRHIT